MKPIIILFILFTGTVNAQMASVIVPPVDTASTIKPSPVLIAPTLWGCADGMEGFDSYCVYKSSGKGLYLIGFDSEGNQNLKLKIEQAIFNAKLDECTIIYNGTEVRLRNRL